MGLDATDRIITESLTIPTIPEIVTRIENLMQDPMAGTRDIGEVVSEDAPLSTKVLRIANSAFYGMRQRVLSVEHATAVLGVRVLKNIVLQSSVIGQYEHLQRIEGFDVRELWKHSILTAQLCRLLSGLCTGVRSLEPEELYTCGLLHDVGKVVMLDCLREEYVRAIEDSRTSGQSLHLSEEEILGFNHTEVGAMVARRWDLPQGVVRAILNHHDELEDVLADPAIAVVHLANRVGERVQRGETPVAAELCPDELGSVLGLTPDCAEQVCDHAQEAWTQIEI